MSGKASVSEFPFYFNNSSGKRLFGFVHLPEKTASATNKGILICNPIFEDRVFAYRFLVNFARCAAARGYMVLRFDYFGWGDSEGDPEPATVEQMLSDIQSAYALMQKEYNVEEISLMGLRFGATLASIYAARAAAVRKLILWNPIVLVERYLNDCLRQTMTMQTVAFKSIILTRDKIIDNILSGRPSVIDGYDLASIDGYPLSTEFYRGAAEINLLNTGLTGRSVFLGLVCPRQKSPAMDEKKLLASLREANAVHSCAVCEPVVFWRDNLIFKNDCRELYDSTLHWLDEAMR